MGGGASKKENQRKKIYSKCCVVDPDPELCFRSGSRPDGDPGIVSLYYESISKILENYSVP
jgi:hypothetical protein